MATAKVRQAGVWVDSEISGKARYGSAWVDFGPGGVAPTYESVSWDPEPASTDNVDPGQAYNMGIKFSMTNAKKAYGVRWRVPDVVAQDPPIDGHVVSIWDDVTGTRIAFKAFTPVPGGYQDILFDAPVDLLSSHDYVAAVYTRHYVYRGSGDSAISPSGNVLAQGGRLVAFNGGSNSYPADPFTAWYYVSPLIEI